MAIDLSDAFVNDKAHALSLDPNDRIKRFEQFLYGRIHASLLRS